MNNLNDSTQSSSNIIKNIYAEELFGYYTYDISGHDTDQLLILYGDNGSGKTTLLKLVYYLLSTEFDKGYKSILVNTKFKTLSVTLSSGIIIVAQRTESLLGQFVYSVKRVNAKKPISTCVMLPVERPLGRLAISASDAKTNKSYIDVLDAIKETGISLYFLKDDRTVMTQYSEKFRTKSQQSFSLSLKDIDLLEDDILGKHSTKKSSKLAIELAFENLAEWIKNKVLKYSNLGETSNQNVYLDLVKSISQSGRHNKTELEDKALLIKQLNDILVQNTNLANIGFVSSFDYDALSAIINGMNNPEKINMVSNVLTPFIEGSQAKLGALNGIYSVITLFIKNVNEYFYDKKIFYNLNEGFWIAHHSGDNVRFSELSSGEQHLLHLWINAITAENATVFIIDEPEISLNIKWQRNLLESLLNYTKNRQIQFVIATHSIELIASNVTSVIKLENQMQHIKTDYNA